MSEGVSEGCARVSPAAAAVAQCEPAVQCDDLVAALNETNNFSKFVVGMRSRFRALCAQP